MSIARLTGRWIDYKKGIGGATGAPGDQPFELLTRYIPVESVTLFVAAMSTVTALTDKSRIPSPWTLYLIFAFAVTPLFVLLAAVMKGRTTPPFVWPIWPLIAATIAFLAWALAVPGLVEDHDLKIIATFSATFISVVLAGIGKIFEK